MKKLTTALSSIDGFRVAFRSAKEAPLSRSERRQSKIDAESEANSNPCRRRSRKTSGGGKYSNSRSLAASATCFAWLLLTAAAIEASDQIPGAPQAQPIALVGGTIHPISGPAVKNGTLLFDKGRIVAIGDNIKLPDDTKRIKIRGKHVYPGLIEAYSQMGLTEISAVRATRDESESGRLNPNVRANVAVNPDSEIIPVTRSNGVLIALTAPSGGLVSGTASVIQLDGWTWEDMTLRANAGLIVNWPGPPNVLKSPDSEKSDSNDGNKSLEQLHELFDEARAYAKARADSKAQKFDIRLDALQSVLNRKTPLIARANGLDTIQSAVAFAAEEKVRLIIQGGYDAPLCADLLKKHNVPVVVSAVYRLPRRRHDEFDAAYTLPERLRVAGIQFCISGASSSRTWNARNLPYHAATAVAYGLPHDEAIKAITIHAAEILGVAKRIGTLERGKDATLIITTGDPLETTSRVVLAFIQGRKVDLSNRHKQLYNKYREKYRRQAAD